LDLLSFSFVYARLVGRECVNEEESELENCECGWLLLFKVFPLFPSHSLSLDFVCPQAVWRWSSFLCGTWCSLMQWFGSLGWFLKCISFRVIWPPLLKVLH